MNLGYKGTTSLGAAQAVSPSLPDSQVSGCTEGMFLLQEGAEMFPLARLMQLDKDGNIIILGTQPSSVEDDSLLEM